MRLHLSLVWEKHLADVKSMWYIINVGCEIMYLNWFERGGKLFVDTEKYTGDTI